MHKHQFSLILAFSLLVSAGCARDKASPALTADPPDNTIRTSATQAHAAGTPTAQPTATSELTEVKVAPTDEPAVKTPPTLAPGGSVAIAFLEMIDGQVGWGIAPDSSGVDHVLRTQDGGGTWREVTPPENLSAGPPTEKMADGFFLNRQSAWVRYLDSGIIWSTGNGGATWMPSEPLDVEIHFPTRIVPKQLQFIDETVGWAMIYLESGMSHDYVTLFQSLDGGGSWEPLIDPMLSPDLQSCCKTGMVFMDSRTGVVTYEQGPYEQVFIDWTFDGGHTWQFHELPSPLVDPDLFDLTYCLSHSPHLFPVSTTIVGVSCTTFEDTPVESHLLYRTDDFGQTWQTLISPEGSLLFLDANLGWALGAAIHQTTDGGQSWVTLKDLNWEGQFDFIDASNGWAVAHAGDQIALVRTTDGGRTWDELDPMIGK